MIVSAVLADLVYGLVVLNLFLAAYLAHRARQMRLSQRAADRWSTRMAESLGERPGRHVRVREERTVVNPRVWE